MTKKTKHSESLDAAISAFGASVKTKLSNPAISGAPEDQLRAPLETFFQDMSDVLGHIKGSTSLVGETTLTSLSTRPDYAVVVREALIGFIEVKAPGKGADPRKFTDKHDKEQWGKLKCLPNLMYTDGNSFSLWHDGQLRGKILHLDGDVETSGASLKAPPTLATMVSDFLTWSPTPPKTAKQLAEVSARLCRLLREEVTEELARGNKALDSLASEWRELLFPQADDDQFADGYAQAVTFGLLMAKAQDISFSSGIENVALELRKSNSLIGTALRLLTDNPDTQKALETSLRTLLRVLDVVDWVTLSKGQPDAWLYFYETFLGIYDNALRKSTGSYYTPPEVVEAMVRLVDEALKEPTLFNRGLGLASQDVHVADPGVGTGTYLLGILRRIAATIEDDQGPGAVSAAIDAAVKRIIGFEIQFGPFAVAQLRVLAELKDLIGKKSSLPEPRLFITDTLGDPYAAETKFSSMLEPIGKSRQDANKIKRDETITVVIGNPPYKEKAKGRGGWIEEGSSGQEKPLHRWMPKPEWGVGAHAKHLYNLYIYFWRWATWKVFGSGYKASTGNDEDDDRVGIVCFITVAGFLNGPGFQAMRADLRRKCSDIWVIDCSPEGHQPNISTRIFQGVQQPVCIVLAARPQDIDETEPAYVHFRALPEGKRANKFAALASLSLHGAGWVKGASEWRAPFLPKATGAWSTFPTVQDLFTYNGSGVMPGRTWVIAPDEQSLIERWDVLITEKDAEKKEILFHPHLRKGKPGDKHLRKVVSKSLAHHPASTNSIEKEAGTITPVSRYAFRSFDRQWIIPDARLINQPNPTIWSAHSKKQVYLTGLEAHSPVNGPAVTLCGLVPDLHHYKGSFGGRVYPLWRDDKASISNIKSNLLAHLKKALGIAVTAESVMAYLTAVMAHPSFTEKFAKDLKQPGLRVPLTADPDIFSKAVFIGEEVIWLHCYGERFDDPKANRPRKSPRMAKGVGSLMPKGGDIPGAPESLPETMAYDAATKRLTIGKGHIINVPQAVWDYEVSGKNILKQWFSYRKFDRRKPPMGDKRPPSPLQQIQPDHWLPEYTTDLIDLLHVLGRLVLLEPKQKDLLDRICAGPLIDADTLEAAGAFDTPKVTGPAKSKASADGPDLLEGL